jgi:hypothetical protein
VGDGGYFACLNLWVKTNSPCQFSLQFPCPFPALLRHAEPQNGWLSDNSSYTHKEAFRNASLTLIKDLVSDSEWAYRKGITLTSPFSFSPPHHLHPAPPPFIDVEQGQEGGGGGWVILLKKDFTYCPRSGPVNYNEDSFHMLLNSMYIVHIDRK